MNESMQLVSGMAKGRLEIYQDARGEWRWRLRSANGKVIAASTEGYRNRSYCAGNAQHVLMREWQNPQGGNLMSNQVEKQIADLRNQQAACGPDDQERAQKLSDRANQLESELVAASEKAAKAPAKEEKKSGKKAGE